MGSGVISRGQFRRMIVQGNCPREMTPDPFSRAAIVSQGRSYSYDDLDAASRRAAGELLGDNEDLRQTRVGYLTAPAFAYAAVQRVIWRAGGVAVQLDVSHPRAEM